MKEQQKCVVQGCRFCAMPNCKTCLCHDLKKNKKLPLKEGKK